MGDDTSLLHSNFYREQFGLVSASNDACPHVSVETPNKCNKKLSKAPKPAQNLPEQVAVDRVEDFSLINESHAHVSVFLPKLLLELPRHKNHADSAAPTSKPALKYRADFVDYVTV